MSPRDLALHYFALSNESNLEAIALLFSEQSTYSSDRQGVFLGRDQIMEMMRAFFSSYSQLSWTVEECKELRPGVVELEFSFRGFQSGQEQKRRGRETIAVFEGRLQHIEVRSL